MAFNEQERLQLSTAALARISGVSKRRIDVLRHPTLTQGKSPRIDEVRRICEAMDYIFPNILPKHGD